MNCFIGEKLKELRIFYNIQQKELAAGICTQSTISRIEKNEIIPNAYLLHQIAQRLAVDSSYFYGTDSLLHLKYVKNVCDDLTRFVRERNFVEVMRIVKREKKNPLFSSPELKQILLWREALCEFYLNKASEKAFQLLEEALAQTMTLKKSNTMIEMYIMLSVATLYGEHRKYEQADQLYDELSEQAAKLPGKVDDKLLTLIAYNRAVFCCERSFFMESVQFSEKAIQICIENLSFYLLGEAYFQKGESLVLMSEVDEGLKWMEKSKTIFDIQKSEVRKDYVVKIINQALAGDFNFPRLTINLESKR